MSTKSLRESVLVFIKDHPGVTARTIINSDCWHLATTGSGGLTGKSDDVRVAVRELLNDGKIYRWKDLVQADWIYYLQTGETQ